MQLSDPNTVVHNSHKNKMKEWVFSELLKHVELKPQSRNDTIRDYHKRHHKCSAYAYFTHPIDRELTVRPSLERLIPYMKNYTGQDARIIAAHVMVDERPQGTRITVFF